MIIQRTIVPVSEWPSRRPLIGYENLFITDGTSRVFSADASDGVHLKENLLDGKEFTYWSPGSGGTHYLSLTGPSAFEVNYAAMHGHTLGDAGATVRVLYKSGGSWIQAETKSIIDNSPIIISFLPVIADEWKIEIISASNYKIAIANIGRSMVMPIGCWEGLTPPWMGRVAESITNVSESGSLLGRSFRRKGIKFSMNFDFIEADFIRGEWMPFVYSAESFPFFVQWNSLEYPQDVAFCWINDASKDLSHPKYTSHSRMSCGVSCVGRVE